VKNYISDEIISPIFENEYISLLEIPFINLFESEISSEQYRAWEEWSNIYTEEIRNHIEDIIDGKKEQPWEVIPIELIKRIWMEYAMHNVIRYKKMEEKLYQMSDLIVTNIVKLYVNTVLSGHTSESVKDAVMEGGYCFKKESENQEEEQQDDEMKTADPSLFPVQYVPPIHKLKPGDYNSNEDCTILPFTEDEYQVKSEDYIYDKNWGQYRISDYAMEPLIKLANELLLSTTAEEQLILIDRVFNVVHSRGDIASLFVKGGSYALSELADNPNLGFK